MQHKFVLSILGGALGGFSGAVLYQFFGWTAVLSSFALFGLIHVFLLLQSVGQVFLAIAGGLFGGLGGTIIYRGFVDHRAPMLIASLVVALVITVVLAEYRASKLQEKESKTRMLQQKRNQI